MDTRILLRYLAVLGVATPVGCVSYSFAGIFTQIKWKKWIVVGLVIFGGLFWYKATRIDNNVVRMKEDVLYIRPNSNIE